MRRLLRHSFLCNNEYSSLADLMAHRPWWIDAKHGRIPANLADWVYISGCRKIAKEATNRAIRAKYRNNLKDMADPEEVEAMSNAEYRRQYDYANTIW